MPNAHDYRDAASRLRRLARQLADDTALMRSATDPSQLAGGPLLSILEHRLDAHLRHADRARDELERVAAICDRRADVCDAFVTAVQRHARLMLGAASSRPPTPPAWWVQP